MYRIFKIVHCIFIVFLLCLYFKKNKHTFVLFVVMQTAVLKKVADPSSNSGTNLLQLETRPYKEITKYYSFYSNGYTYKTSKHGFCSAILTFFRPLQCQTVLCKYTDVALLDGSLLTIFFLHETVVMIYWLMYHID